MRSHVFLLALLTLGCGVPEEEHAEVVSERDALKGRIKTLEDDLDLAKAKVKELEIKLEKVDTKPNRPPAAQVAAARAQLELSPDTDLQAVLKTSKGDIDCELWPDIAPETVLNFVGLAEGTKEWTDPESGEKTVQPLYDGTKFHRVIASFMIQGGDPLGNGSGGPGYTFGDEVWPDVRFDRPGLLAMANRGPDTNGSQFFITTSKPAHLNMKHTIFGECELEVVREIAAVEVGGPGNSTPVEDVVLETVKILRD